MSRCVSPEHTLRTAGLAEPGHGEDPERVSLGFQSLRSGRGTPQLWRVRGRKGDHHTVSITGGGRGLPPARAWGEGGASPARCRRG